MNLASNTKAKARGGVQSQGSRGFELFRICGMECSGQRLGGLRDFSKGNLWSLRTGATRAMTRSLRWKMHRRAPAHC